MSEVDDIIATVSPYYGGRKSAKEKGVDISIASRETKLVYDSTSEQLEPLYFWVLDMMNDMFKKVEKVSDTFASSPGSGHFSELQGKASQMQQEASRVLGTVNNILKGVLNLIYDLKEFKIRLSHYDAANSKDKLIAESGLLALKQVWMDRVDIQRGAGSLNALSSGDLNFVTLRDAFLSAKNLEEADKLDLNERVKRILKPRLQEFFEWRKRSEFELKKRFEIEKTYLKSQVDALKLNSRWSKPYLRAAQQLTQNEKLQSNPAMVTVFNTLIIELVLMGMNKVDVEGAVISKELPRGFEKDEKLKKYNSVVFVEFNFRGIPQKFGQHYVFGGKADVYFKAFCLTNDEIELFKKKMSESDMDTALKLVKGMTDDSLMQLKTDLKELLGEDVTEKEKAKKAKEDTNPLSSLFNFKGEKSDKTKTPEEILKDLEEKTKKKEGYVQKYVRSYGEASAINTAFIIYDIYKKNHGMASFPYGGEASYKAPGLSAEKFFWVK